MIFYAMLSKFYEHIRENENEWFVLLKSPFYFVRFECNTAKKVYGQAQRCMYIQQTQVSNG